MTKKTQLQLRDRLVDVMKNDDLFLDVCLLKLFEQQTIDERQIKNSMYRNAVGFNRPDAYLLSDYSIWKLNFPNRSINGDLKTKLIKKLEKYALQLSSYEEVVTVLDGLKDPTLIFARIKNEIDVDKLDPTTSLEDYLYHRKEERAVAQREHNKKKREEERRKKFELTHDTIKGTIVEIEPKAIKIKMTLEDFEADHWFPKFSIIENYKEELSSLQEFMIKKRMLFYKREEALSEIRHHDTTPTL
ncbi:MAG: hypothetical protein ACW990_10475 [Promethearchaeota archaeon]